MHRSIAIVIGILIVLILVGFNTTYSVNFHEVAIKTRFGKPVEVVREPGLHFKAPFFIDRITKLDTRKQLIDSPLETVLTKDEVIDDSSKDGLVGYFPIVEADAGSNITGQLKLGLKLIRPELLNDADDAQNEGDEDNGRVVI